LMHIFHMCCDLWIDVLTRVTNFLKSRRHLQIIGPRKLTRSNDSIMKNHISQMACVALYVRCIYVYVCKGNIALKILKIFCANLQNLVTMEEQSM
jgi:hypothetical protein